MATGPGFRDQATYRSAFRIGGGLLVGVGIVLVLIGFADFVGSANDIGLGRPRSPNMWPLFIGIPMVGLGSWLLWAGFLGAGARYLAGELAPTARESLDYVEGRDDVRCPSCGAAVEPAAKFCPSCGAAVGSRCQSCGVVSDPAARYCSSCGIPLRPSG